MTHDQCLHEYMRFKGLPLYKPSMEARTYRCDKFTPKQRSKEREISPQQEEFLENLFENGGNVTDAALSRICKGISDMATQ